jgi:LacI family transcriptional regulator
MNSISSAGLRVPDDFSIVGCNNQSFSANLNPPLTSIDLNLREIGKCGAEILNSPEKRHKTLYEFPVKVVERKSVISLNK